MTGKRVFVLLCVTALCWYATFALVFTTYRLVSALIRAVR